jgi:hypothetical protein
MSLIKFSYSEFENDPRYWVLQQCDFSAINLVVGRNATGKTRLINVVNALCRILSARQTGLPLTGTFQAEICLSGKTYSLCLEFSDGKVAKESLKVNGTERLSRDATGAGEIYYEAKGEVIRFQVPPTTIAIQQRQDELQHPFVVELSKWALGCRTYFFGSSFGKDQIVGLASLQLLLSQNERPGDVNDPLSVYMKAFNQFGAPFDEAVIKDMNMVGYDLTDVSAEDIRPLTPGLILAEPAIGLTVTERDRGVKLPQFHMSQGMFRALALIIHINASSFGKQRTLIMVDDVGEGLDFERSAKLIDLLINHAERSNIQVIMTSNDRFVMNRIPLNYWSLLRRTGSNVHAYTEHNSPKEFEDFKYMGLSNFDFFTSDIFK